MRRMVAHSYHELLLSSKKNQTVDTHKNLEESSNNYFEWKKKIAKGYTLYYSNYKSTNDKTIAMKNN